jgi:menaquinone-specific isochorismate synthase
VAIERAHATDSKTVLVLGFNAPSGDPLGWLAHHQGVPSVYWRGRDGWESAGLGAVHVIAHQGPSALRDAANEAAEFIRDQVVHESAPQARRPRFFGGFAFDPQNLNRGRWADGGFGDAVLILPEATYVRRDTQSYVFFSFEVTSRSTPDTLVDRLALLNEIYWHGFDCPSRADSIGLGDGQTSDEADREYWVRHSTEIIHGLEQGEFQKVVLAQSRALTLASGSAGSLNPWPVVAALRDFDPVCYQFGFQLSDRYAFVGASPERLFRLSGRTLESEAVAGTIGRGADDTEDFMLSERLVASAKDQLEHRYVVEAVQSGLSELSSSPSAGPDSKLDIVQLHTLQHLRSSMTVEARADVTVGDILAALHPTPAVGGVPRDKSCAAIRAHERSPRGWYGGPVGWVGGDAAEFAVGIRSALLGANEAWLYAGAGLVRGSVPENEWTEIQDKLQAFRSAVNSPRPTP